VFLPHIIFAVILLLIILAALVAVVLTDGDASHT
jgi:hypothetical protein